jgi:hypothetical protein
MKRRDFFLRTYFDEEKCKKWIVMNEILQNRVQSFLNYLAPPSSRYLLIKSHLEKDKLKGQDIIYQERAFLPNGPLSKVFL